MKKILLFASLVFAFAFAKAGSYEVNYNNAPLHYGDTITIIAEDGECEVFFSVIVTASNRIPTFISTNRTNNSDTYITSICADDWCASNTSHSSSYTPNSFPFDGNSTYLCHIEFDSPDGTPNAIFKVRIYSESSPSDNYEFYIKVVTNTVGINQLSAINSQISIYPNPASTMVNITLADKESGEFSSDVRTVALCNMAGQQVYETVVPTGASTVAISVADLPKGVYNLILSNGKNIASKKLIVK